MSASMEIAPPERVFPTGANGFIGRALAQRYRHLGAEVRGVDLVVHAAAVVSMVVPLEVMRAGQFLLPDAGQGVFSPVYIDDLVDGIVLAAGKPEGAGQIFTLTWGVGVSCAEYFGHHWRWLGKTGSPRTLPRGLAISLAEAGAGIARLLGRRTKLGRGAVELLGRPATYSIGKARQLLGYSPAVNLAEGMRRSEAWARAEGLCDPKL